MSRTQQEEQNDHECELAAWELLQDAKATADHWMQKAKEAEQAANDLVSELIDTRREWKEELTTERALADRLAGALMVTRWDSYTICKEALAAWKEARSE